MFRNGAVVRLLACTAATILLCPALRSANDVAPNDSEQNVVAALKIGNLPPLPVFHDLNAANLERGAVWIRGTANSGGAENIGIVGREMFSHFLKDLSPGDPIVLYVPAGARSYAVEEVGIFRPEEIDKAGVFEDRGMPSITLVTEFPLGSRNPGFFVIRGTLCPPDHFRILASHQKTHSHSGER